MRWWRREHQKTASTDWKNVFRLVIESWEKGGEVRMRVADSHWTIGGRSVQILLDLAGSEKTTSDKERAQEGKYINTKYLSSQILKPAVTLLIRLSAVLRSEGYWYSRRDSECRQEQEPSLSSDASTAQRQKKKEVVDTNVLIERYHMEIEEPKNKPAEQPADAPVRNPRFSTQCSSAGSSTTMYNYLQWTRRLN
ncbi:hypothetical protein BU15DRAFT_61535 [Melanogaster broomeanus]|nr:hypothetical protein BU15DRAFT_61535 [Melanogaster broomeanus]